MKYKEEEDHFEIPEDIERGFLSSQLILDLNPTLNKKGGFFIGRALNRLARNFC